MRIDRTAEGKVIVTNGVDVYDPTPGQIRSSSTDDIACWFIDTNYNQESFFVRHAYFTGENRRVTYFFASKSSAAELRQ